MTKSPVGWEPVRYCVDADTMTIEVRPWPGGPASRERARTPASIS